MYIWADFCKVLLMPTRRSLAIVLCALVVLGTTACGGASAAIEGRLVAKLGDPHQLR